MHIVWDWNGTLLDDTGACIGALNEMLARRGLEPISVDFYRKHFAFPVRSFYESIGVKLENEDWNRLAREYHDEYHARPAQLARGTFAALERVKGMGEGQSILSALRQDMLATDSAKFGVAGYMHRIWGSDNLDGGSKLESARRFFNALVEDGVVKGDLSDAVMIGDAIHDWEVASALGVKCVLFSGGGHSRERLLPLAPVADTPLEAVDLACAFFAKTTADLHSGPHF